MIKAVSELGEYLIGREGKEPLSILVEDPRTKYVLSIVLRKVMDGYEYEKVELGEFQAQNKERYLYRRGASQGADVTPSSIITDLERKTYDKKFVYWFSDKNLKTLDMTNLGEFTKIKVTLENNRKKILADSKKMLSDLNPKEKKQGILLTLEFKENGGSKYIGDLEVFKKALINRSTSNYYKKYSLVSLGRNTLCSLCFKKADEVYGFTSDIFPFYTLDKPGFAPDFNPENGWKLYPVCSDCALRLEAGKRYIEEKLDLNFYGGFRYYLIPKVIFTTNQSIYDKMFDLFEEYAKDPSFSRKERGWIGGLVDNEDRIFQLFSEEKNVLALNFLFYERPNKKELKILLHINEILPSRLRRLYEIKKDVDNIELFTKNNLKFNFEIMYNIFVRSKEKDASRKYYLDTAGKIFTGRPVDYEFILGFLIRRIRKNFVNGWGTKELTFGGLMLFRYLHKLGILHNFGGTKIMKGQLPSQALGQYSGSASEIANKLFEEFGDFFNSNDKKAIFLEGVLAQKLLKIQFTDRGSTPFVKKLNGLKLDEKKVKALLPIIQGKLEEYGKNYYKELEKLISDYFVASDKNWDLSNDEISYYFTLGMNLVDLFKTDKKEGGESDE